MEHIAQIIQCLDLTNLNEQDDESAIRDLCQKARTALGDVAAVCVYPNYVSFAKNQLRNTPIKIATVVNFPKGNGLLSQVIKDTHQAIHDGADEIDVVIPYNAFLETHDSPAVCSFVSQVKKACQNKTLKTILETGAFSEENKIYTVACACIEGGADFIKTSTGKIAIGAQIEAVNAMLKAIQDMSAKGYACGLKVSGGIRDVSSALLFFNRMQNYLGNIPDKSNFRIGASKVIDELLMETCRSA